MDVVQILPIALGTRRRGRAHRAVVVGAYATDSFGDFKFDGLPRRAAYRLRASTADGLFGRNPGRTRG